MLAKLCCSTANRKIQSPVSSQSSVMDESRRQQTLRSVGNYLLQKAHQRPEANIVAYAGAVSVNNQQHA